VIESVAPATKRPEAGPTQQEEQVARERLAREQAAKEHAAREQAKEEQKQKEIAERAFWSPRIKTMLERLAGCQDFYRFPDIPAQKLSRAQAICLAPPSEEVFGLVYCQSFLVAPSFILFSESGMYIHRRETRTRIAYSELRNMRITAESTRTLELGIAQITIPVWFSMQMLADALNTMIKDLGWGSIVS
jgi:hypothetical protein